MASHHRVLMVGEEGVILYAPLEKGIGREAAISWGAKDFDSKMAEALHRAGDDVVVLFNEADHTYRKEENLPVTQCQSRLEKAFPDFLTRAAMPMMQAHDSKTDAGSGNFLFIGMPESERHGRLGHAIEGAGVHVAGIGVLPIELAALVEELARKVFHGKSRWALLAGQHETGGMRHVCIKDGNLALTRIFPLDDVGTSTPAAWGATAMSELRATMTYLRRFGYTPDQGMDMMMVCDQSEKKLFAANAIEDAELRCLTLSETLRHLGYQVEGQTGDHFADALYAAWAERHQLKLQLHIPAIEG